MGGKKGRKKDVDNKEFRNDLIIWHTHGQNASLRVQKPGQ